MTLRRKIAIAPGGLLAPGSFLLLNGACGSLTANSSIAYDFGRVSSAAVDYKIQAAEGFTLATSIFKPLTFSNKTCLSSAAFRHIMHCKFPVPTLSIVI
jgi:hypothetical protein